MNTKVVITPTMSSSAEKGTYTPQPPEEDKYLIQYITAFSGMYLITISNYSYFFNSVYNI